MPPLITSPIFDNVGGKILNDMLALIATAARVVICGGISRYETGSLPAGPENYFNLVFRRATMQGFIVLDYAAEFPEIRQRMAGMIKSSKLQYREDVQEGFENTPKTLMRLFSGSNFGKQLLKLS
jgi:NADPH-dependent curcumin reductase CurA